MVSIQRNSPLTASYRDTCYPGTVPDDLRGERRIWTRYAPRRRWLTRVVGNAQNMPFCAACQPHPAAAELAQIGSAGVLGPPGHNGQ
jgi:hypothetical protein